MWLFPATFRAQVDFFVCRRTGVILKSPSSADVLWDRESKIQIGQWIGRREGWWFVIWGWHVDPVMFSLLTLWFPTLCSQGRPLKCPHQRRLPKNRRRDAEEHSGDEGKLLGREGRWGRGSPGNITRTVIPACDSHLHIVQLWGNSCLLWIILFGGIKENLVQYFSKALCCNQNNRYSLWVIWKKLCKQTLVDWAFHW